MVKVFVIQEEKPLFASVTSPFIYSDFDVKYHRRALGCILDTSLKNEESTHLPHPLFGLIPAQHSILANIKRLANELHIDLSTLKLKEHFIRFKDSLPGSGTVICRTRLRDVTGSFCTKYTNIIIEGSMLEILSLILRLLSSGTVEHRG